MTPFLEMLVFTSLSAFAIPLGGLLGMASWLLPRWLEQEVRHTVLAAGGGILVGTVAFALIPHGAELLPRPWIVVLIGVGAVAFCGLDIMIQKVGNDGAQLVAMLADFLPETLAVGASFAIDDGRGRVLALLIAAQNLPEAFNAFREMTRRSRRSAARVLADFFALATLGPLAGVLANVWLAGLPVVIGAVMLFVSGGILYLTFQDIAPRVRLKKHWAPPFGAVGGVVIALAAQWLTGG